MSFVYIIVGVVSILLGITGIVWDKERLRLLAEKNEFPKKNQYKVMAFLLISLGVLGIISGLISLFI
jgi:hypothetical protein